MSALPDFEDDDITGQITQAMREPVSSPETAIQELRAHALSLAHRTRRIERTARWLAGIIIASSLTVATTVVAAAYAVGADQARDRERIEEVIRRLDRLDGRASAHVERIDR